MSVTITSIECINANRFFRSLSRGRAFYILLQSSRYDPDGDGMRIDAIAIKLPVGETLAGVEIWHDYYLEEGCIMNMREYVLVKNPDNVDCLDMIAASLTIEEWHRQLRGLVNYHRRRNTSGGLSGR